MIYYMINSHIKCLQNHSDISFHYFIAISHLYYNQIDDIYFHVNLDSQQHQMLVKRLQQKKKKKIKINRKFSNDAFSDIHP